MKKSQITTQQNKAQKITNQLNKEVLSLTKGTHHIQPQTGIAYQLNPKDFNTKKTSLIAKRVNDDLEVTFAESVLIFDNYFTLCKADLSCLVSLPTEDGGLYHVVADTFFTLEDGTQVVYFYGEQSIVATESSATSTDDNQSFSDVIASNIGIVAAVVVAAVVVASSGSGSDGDGDDTTQPLAIALTNDAGSSNSDGISKNGEITIKHLKSGDTWEYSTDGGNSFISGTGNSFVLASGTYGANDIQIKVSGSATIIKYASSITIDTLAPSFTSAATAKVEANTEASTTIYTAATDDNTVTYTLKAGEQQDKFTISNTGELKYKQAQTQAGTHTVTIIATDIAGNTAEKTVSVSVVDIGLLTSITWNNIGTDNIINTAEMATATLSGTVSVIGTVSSISVSSIVFKQGDTTVHVITTNLPAIVNNTWALANNSAWTSKLTQGDYTVIVNLAGKGASNQDVTGLNSITTKIDITQPAQPTFTLTNDTGVSNSDGVTNNGMITVASLESDATWQYSTNGGTNWTNGTGTSFTLTEGTHAIDAIQVKQTNIAGNVSSVVKNASAIVVDTSDPLFAGASTANVAMNATITTTVYDAQASNLNGGNADDGITYSIKNASTSKFAITTDTGIVTYKAIQTTVHTDAVTIIATDVAGNTTERVVAVSVRGSVAQGFVMNGENVEDHSGKSVSSAGDVNGDGLDDLIVGAYQADPDNKDKAGKTYVVFGKTDGSAVNLSAIALGTGGFVINGENAGDNSGNSVSSVGDVNGDGLDDLIVSTNLGDTYTGKSYVVFGKTNESAVNLSVIAAGTGGFVINGENADDWSGYSVSSAGDVNGDDLDDLIVGAFLADTNGESNAGKSYVVFGKTNESAVNLSVIAAGTGGFVINGENADDWSGYSVSSAGDVNGDGLDDLIVGAFQADLANKSKAGKSYVIFGKTDETSVDLSKIASGTGGFVINGENTSDRSGASVSSAGDVNGDGLDDLIVGAYLADPSGTNDAGKSYVVFGKKDKAAVDLSVIALGTGGFVINGENAGDYSGVLVSSVGDVNGDGLDDLIVGAHKADPDNKSNAGKSYVVFGKTNGSAVDLSAIASGTGGFVINGENIDDGSGISVSSAGDVNGDGLDDLIVGARQADPSSKNKAGKSYVVFGKTDTKAVDLADVSTGKGVVAHTIDFQGNDDDNTLTGTSTDELFVAGLGDDTLIGNGGTDVFNAGAGNDTIVINADNLAKLSSKVLSNHLLARVDGGGNTDTLKLAGADLNLDLTQIDNGRIQDIEIIDLTGSGNNTLKLNLNDLLDISTSTNVLKVVGNSGDTVEVKTRGFEKSNATEVVNGITYDIYSHASASTAKLWLAQNLTVSLTSIAQGFVMNGESAGDFSGRSVSSAGDVNGDGLDDLIVGAFNADPDNKSNAGKSYVVFGKKDKVAVDLSTIASGTGGFVINGESAEDNSGISVSSAGDVNGDGLDDLIVGANLSESYAGKSYVVFGKTDGSAVNLSVIAAGTGGFVINGENANDNSGISVSSAGDVNGDGLDDLIIGAYRTENQTGRSYVVFGKKDKDAVSLSIIASGTGGFVINGENEDDLSGRSVSSAGDVNGDGLDDLIVGAYKADPNSKDKAGKSYVVFGKTNESAVDLSAIASASDTGGFVINGESAEDNSGISVSSAGDVNGDGLDDLIVGAFWADPASKTSAGKSYVVFGKTNGSAVDLSVIASGTDGFVINGENANDFSGYSVSSAGDVNGDGLDDLVVGAYYADPDSKSDAGKSYVVFGKTNGSAVDLSVIASGAGGFVINGENADDWSGLSVSSAGDVNGDGLDDLIVGAFNADPNNKSDAGKSYVVFGKTDTKAVDLADISASNGVVAHAIDFQGNGESNILTGTSADELFVAGLGNDVLTGNGGADVFNAGKGDDIIIINADNLAKLSSKVLSSDLLARVDGGGNTDTLKLAGADLNLDLTQIDNGRIQDIEIIDLTGSGNNTLKLNLHDLLDISSSTNFLKVIGDTGDKVDIGLSDNAFAKDSTKTEDGITYDIYNNVNAADTVELWVEQDLAVF
ncbi:FG-GAP-like repeat-containing protein [Bathymodiolus thermophilus thioautotrophic gill symbiont]|uniref:Alpha integrin n=3 Tax=Bathymodiolus thermophilus thioautotrophic gill symbiont TaxID=2360 RepID=A0A8H8XB04_9GAMM|nr:FG-GAP-like repeat-containing protein [Bathymodiolus thermophilus thioautotrophic gill symbiont]CAB5495011.1 hypothetical protein THERMOS_208 [Bathymodiolus thermophilus thioautotrophic gill symbiont]